MISQWISSENLARILQKFIQVFFLFFFFWNLFGNFSLEIPAEIPSRILEIPTDFLFSWNSFQKSFFFEQIVHFFRHFSRDTLKIPKDSFPNFSWISPQITLEIYQNILTRISSPGIPSINCENYENFYRGCVINSSWIFFSMILQEIFKFLNLFGNPFKNVSSNISLQVPSWIPPGILPGFSAKFLSRIRQK